MELMIGPFDPVLHVRSRDHFEAIRREAQLLALEPDSPPRRYEALMDRFRGQFPPTMQELDASVDRAYRAGERRCTVRLVIPDEQVPDALAACDAAEATLGELDRWAARNRGEEFLPTPPEVAAYRDTVLGQIREQLERALDTRGQPGPRR
jgi:hypothetical protein